jgi:hypothetical protein
MRSERCGAVVRACLNSAHRTRDMPMAYYQSQPAGQAPNVKYFYTGELVDTRQVAVFCLARYMLRRTVDRVRPPRQPSPGPDTFCRVFRSERAPKGCSYLSISVIRTIAAVAPLRTGAAKDRIQDIRAEGRLQ